MSSEQLWRFAAVCVLTAIVGCATKAKTPEPEEIPPAEAASATEPATADEKAAAAEPASEQTN